MEDIYDDLTNYEDVNALEELRTENEELKGKLEKCSASMEKLQKEILQDYDTLEAEFKTLEHNYSSLLMTARSEIQRKTQRINQLNSEKDLMVLDALKSGIRIRRNFSKGQTKYEAASGKGNNKENVQQKYVDIKKERREAPVMPPKVAVPEPSTCDRNKTDNAGIKIELSSTCKSSVDDNNTQRKTDLNGPPKTSAGSIKDRRKSMPAVSMPIDTFTSDDEIERSYQTKDTTDLMQSDNARRNTNNIPIDRHSNKTTETSSVDERMHNYHDSISRDNYKGKSNRYHDSNTYRSWDKYDDSLKYRKRYTPERGQKRPHREHYDDYHRYERERYKERHLESPPPEPYNRYQHRKSDHRSEYRRYSHEKVKYYHEDKYLSSKYRSKEYDEPHAKRLRSESYGYSACSKEDKRHYYEREPVDAQPVSCFSPHEEYDILRFSCQSPDFEHTVSHPAKEIKDTAATPLDDPRETSERYVVWKGNGKETLSTVIGRNINITPVNKAKWDIKTVDMPDALVHPPSQCSDQLVKDIYVNIDNPVTNLDLSIESGEVVETDRESRNKSRKIQHDTRDFKISKQVRNDIPKLAPDVLKIPTTKIAGYRIPKTEQNKQNTHSKPDVPIIDLDENVPHHKDVYGKTAGDSSSKDLLTHNQQYSEREERVNVEDTLPNNKQYEIIKKSRSKEAEGSLRRELSTHKQQYNERVKVKDPLPDNKKYSKIEGLKKSRSIERQDSLRRNFVTHKEQNEHETRANFDNSVSKNNHYSKTEDYKKSRSRERELSTTKQQNNERKERVNKEEPLPNSKMECKRSKGRSENPNQATFTKIATIADDLELSDDNSDHMDTNKGVFTTKLQKICDKPIHTNEVVTDNSGNCSDQKTLTSCHNTEIVRTVDNAETKDVVKDEKCKELDTARKQKNKKKKSKAKEISKDIVESAADEKTPRSKKEKESTPRETKEKFSDLFGDSSSLMTPEDLGIPSYLPISEDVQDAVDMKINQIIDATPTNDNYEIIRDVQTQNKVEDYKIQHSKPHDDIPKAVLQISNTDVDDKVVTDVDDKVVTDVHDKVVTDVDDKVVTNVDDKVVTDVDNKVVTEVDDKVFTEIEKKLSKISEENVVEPSQLPSPIVYENLNPDLNDLNVVKTVIISTGKQPEIPFENKVVDTKSASAVEINVIPDTSDMHLFPATKEYKSDLLKALATSTPHKEFSAVNPFLPDSAITNDICDPCVSKAVSTITNAEQVFNGTDTNTLETNDAPDVRIFVKRRRKIVKRPPMT